MTDQFILVTLLLVISYLGITSRFKANIVTDPTKHPLWIFIMDIAHIPTTSSVITLFHTAFTAISDNKYRHCELHSTTGVVGRVSESAPKIPSYKTASPGLLKLQAVQSSHRGEKKPSTLNCRHQGMDNQV